MSAREQLELDYESPHFAASAWRRVVAEVKAYVSRTGLKQVAFDIDQKPSDLSNALAERNRSYLRGQHLIEILIADRDALILAVVARLCGFDLKPIEATGPEAVNKAYRSVLRRQFGDRFFDVVDNEVKKELRQINVAAMEGGNK